MLAHVAKCPSTTGVLAAVAAGVVVAAASVVATSVVPAVATSLVVVANQLAVAATVLGV